MKYNYTVLIEQGEDGAYIATIPAIKSCYTQADTIPDLLSKTKEAIELCLEANGELPLPNRFIGVQQMEIAL
jgi:predicted RNase H-like HicB family nuclease